MSEINKVPYKVKPDLIEDISNLIFGKAPTKEDYILNMSRAYISGTFEQMFSDETTIKTVD